MTTTIPLPALMTRIKLALFRNDYTQFVRIMKVTLPALSLMLMVLVVIWAKLAAQTDGFRIGYAAITSESVKTLRMVNARYYGVDTNDNPFSVTADTGAQRSNDSDLIDMEFPKADFVSKSGASVIVSADHGLYHQKTQLLDLSGNVNLYHELGYEMHTDTAQVDLKADTAQGNDPVQGQGPQGRLDGIGFQISEKGERIVVKGRSSVSLRGSQHSSSGSKPR